MSSTSRLQSSQVPPTAQDLAVVTSAIARLRAEHDRAQDSRLRAVLLYEIGVLEERVGDETASVRDQLGAVNAEADFREPLERLIAIIERRQSYKNLGRLLERLVSVADRPEERARALLDQAFYRLDHEDDPAEARTLLERATSEMPSDASAWLALELIAAKLGDSELRERALLGRATLTAHPHWKALLLSSLAELRESAGNAEGAASALEEALVQESPATFDGLSALVELGQRSSDPALALAAQIRIAETLTRAGGNPALSDALGIPPHLRSEAATADAWLAAAELSRGGAAEERAKEQVLRALSFAPRDPLLHWARSSLAQATTDRQTRVSWAQAELESGASGAHAAALWMELSEARAADGDAPAALQALNDALAQDPDCIPARAEQLDQLSGGDDPQALAAALEAGGESMPSDAAKSRAYLLSAEVWSRRCEDNQGARAALSQAGMYGASPAVIARLARLLSALSADGPWYEEATRRLLAQGASETEQAGLWFELARARALRGETPATAQALAGLAAAPGGRWLGTVLAAYVLGLLPQPSGELPAQRGYGLEPGTEARALVALAAEERDEERARALQVIVALRALIDGDRDAARSQFEQLQRADPSDLTVTRALATLEGAAGSKGNAAAALTRTSALQDDRDVALALGLEAGILHWQAGDRRVALEHFEPARGTRAGAALYGWALRAVDAPDLPARRNSLDAAAETEPELAALERFGLEVFPAGDADAAREALSILLEQPSGELYEAGLLARALWSPGGNEEDERASALEKLAAHEERAALARGALYAIELSRTPSGADSGLTEAARAWAVVDTSLPPALEWLGAATGASDVEAEVEARQALAKRLPSALAAPLEASAALVAWLSGSSLPPPLISEFPAAKLANLELAVPGGDPRRRAYALLDIGEDVGDGSSSVRAALAGYNQLAYGDAVAALDSFRRVVEAYPEELLGWEGLRSAADAIGDRATLAEACAALGDAVSDASEGSELWERAALILLDELGDSARGEYALSRAVERDVRRFAAFDRLFRLVRQRKDAPRLLELVARRLDVAEDPEEIAKLFWERARVLRGSGDRDGALAALENVRLLEPEHVGALALSGEIYITLGRFAEAAENLARLAALADAPGQQRLMSGIAAVDLYENKLDDVYAALDVLSNLHDAGLSTLAVRERLARAAARAEAWPEATRTLELLMTERASEGGRAEAARLAMVIYRDRQNAPGQAQAAVEQLLREIPDDGEALDLVLSSVFSRELAVPLLERGLEELTERLSEQPLDAERVERTARIAAYLGKSPLRQAALGALVALGVTSDGLEQELVRIDQRVSNVPRIAIDDSALPNLVDPEDHGPIPELMRAVATTICEELGPSLAAFGVGKKERVDARLGLPVRNEIAAWAGALGVGEFELYIGGRDPDLVVAIASELPALVLGSAVSAPLSPRHRQAVARELFALRRGTTVLRHREGTEIGALVVAACRVAEVALPAPAYAMLPEFQRALAKMPRKVKKALPELALRVVESGQDPTAWTRAAISSLDRLAAIAAGDVSWVLASGGRERGALGLSDAAAARAKRLLSFVLSPSYLELREQLGMGVK